MKKWVLAIAGIVLVAVGVYLGFTYLWKEETATATAVRTTPVIRGNLTVTVSGSGTVSVVNVKQVMTPEEGQLEALTIKEGELVAKGQVIASYVAVDHSEEIRKLETSLTKQEMELEKLKTKYIEAEESSRPNVRYEIESLKLDMAANEQSQAELKEEQATVTTITAPIAGKVTAIHINEAGQKVQSGAAILTITDYKELQSVIQVDELDVTKVKVGQKAKVMLDALEEMEIEGTVTEIADEGSSQNGVALFDVTIQFPAQEGIRIGMSASAEITVDSKQDVLMVPIEAIREAGSQKMVLVAASASGASGSGAGSTPARGGQGDGMPQGRGNGAVGDETSGSRSEAASGQAGSSEVGQSERASAGASSKSSATMREEPQLQQTAEAEQSRRAQMQGEQPEGSQGPGMAQRQGGNQGQGRAAGAANESGGMMRFVTVGVSNETYIEIISGLSEGEEVILPTIVSSASQTNMTGFPGAGGGGFGGGGMPAGGFSGGGGGMQRPSSGGGAQRGG